MSNFGNLPDFDPYENRKLPRPGMGMTILGVVMLVLGSLFAISPYWSKGYFQNFFLVFTIPIGSGAAIIGVILVARGASLLNGTDD